MPCRLENLEAAVQSYPKVMTAELGKNARK